MEKEDKHIQAFESKAQRRFLGITYRQHKTNKYVHEQIKNQISKYEYLLFTIK